MSPDWYTKRINGQLSTSNRSHKQPHRRNHVAGHFHFHLVIGSSIMEIIINTHGILLLAHIKWSYGVLKEKVRFYRQKIYQSSVQQLIISASNHHDRYIRWTSKIKYTIEKLVARLQGLRFELH